MMLSATIFLCNLYMTMPEDCGANENNLHLEDMSSEHQMLQDEYHLNEFSFFRMDPALNYEESAGKRGKLIFFISLPFILLTYTVVVATLHYAADQNNSFSRLPTEPFLFAGLSSLAIVGGIIYLDIQETRSTDQKKQINFFISGTQPL